MMESKDLPHMKDLGMLNRFSLSRILIQNRLINWEYTPLLTAGRPFVAY